MNDKLREALIAAKKLADNFTDCSTAEIYEARQLIDGALSAPQADAEPVERDPYGEAEQWGMQYALALFGRHIAGIEQWEAGAGSESVDGDVITEFHNIAKAAGWIGVNGDTIFGIAPPSQSAEMRKALEKARNILKGPHYQGGATLIAISDSYHVIDEALSGAGDGKESEGSPVNPDQGVASQHEYPDESRSGLNSSRNQSAPSDLTTTDIATAFNPIQPCGDCPPVGYPTDNTRCLPCPRRADESEGTASAEGRVLGPDPCVGKTRDVQKNAGGVASAPSDPTSPDRESIARIIEILRLVDKHVTDDDDRFNLRSAIMQAWPIKGDPVIDALRSLVAAFVNPGDGQPFEEGEVPEIDEARAILALLRGGQHER